MANPATNEMKIPQAARRLRLTAVTVLALGAALSVFFWRARNGYERRELDAALSAESDSLAAAVSREVETFASVLTSMRQLHTLSAHITDEDFREFVTKGLAHPTAVLHAFGFAQNITAADRAQIEADSGPRALHIIERDGRGGFRAAGARTQYFPLTYQFPDEGIGVSNGFDLATSPLVAAAVERMSLAGGLAICGPEWGPQGRDYLALAPIIYVMTGKDGRPTGGYLTGFVAGLFRPPSILAPALKLAEGRGLKLSLVDHPPAGKPQMADENGARMQERPLEVLGQIWTLRFVAEPKFTGHYLTAQPQLLLTGGLAFTCLFALQLFMLGRHAASVENEVRLRTAELRAANEALEKSMAERRRLEQEVLDISTQEQQRVGRDLHDSLGQKLTGAAYLSRALSDELAGAPQGAAAAKINGILKDATAQARRIARGLSPIDLSEGGLADALRRLAEETSQVFNISCLFHGDSAPVLGGGTTASNLYQIAQEAVNNAVRHGAAKEITILLEGTAGRAGDDQKSGIGTAKNGELVIEDNGRGLPPNATQGDGMGLRIMRYRASLIGGELKIERGRDGGTTVVCRFPI